MTTLRKSCLFQIMLLELLWGQYWIEHGLNLHEFQSARKRVKAVLGGGIPAPSAFTRVYPDL
jgi:hypothetical protein